MATHSATHLVPMNRAWGWTLVLHLSACASPSPFDQPADGTLADSGAAYVPGAQWRIASAPRAGFDSARIATLTRDLTSGRYGSIDAVLIVRHGYLVYERYDGWVTRYCQELWIGMIRRPPPRPSRRPAGRRVQP